MKVILLEKYKKLGQVGEVIDVKNGFARNYLIPNGKAVQATKANIADFDARKAELLEESKKKEEVANKLSSKIKGKIINIIKQAGDDGRLYGAVHSNEIADELKKLGSDITRKQVILNYSIKFIGIYEIDIDLGEGVFSSIYMNVARSEGEAEESSKKFKSGEIQLTTANSDLRSVSTKAEPQKAEAEAKPAQEASAESATEEQPAA